MSTGLRELIAGLGASGTFIGLLSLTQLGLLPGLGLAAVVYLALRLLLPEPFDQKEIAEGVTRVDLDRTKGEIQRSARRFQELGQEIADPEVAKNAAAIGRTVRDLVSHFERDPKNLHRAESFLSMHLPRALEIVERYTWLGKQPYLDAAAREELRASGETVALIGRAFEAQHRQLLSEDFREFKVDRMVFEELLRLDPGLGSSTREGKKESE